MKDNNEQVLYKIKSLKKEMVHWSIESTSITILALLLFIGAPSVFPKIIDPYNPSSLKIMQGIIIVPTAFWLLTILGNLVRCVMVYKLKKQLSSKSSSKKK